MISRDLLARHSRPQLAMDGAAPRADLAELRAALGKKKSFIKAVRATAMQLDTIATSTIEGLEESLLGKWP